jgi:hypothetical protein
MYRKISFWAFPSLSSGAFCRFKSAKGRSRKKSIFGSDRLASQQVIAEAWPQKSAGGGKDGSRGRPELQAVRSGAAVL